MVWLGRSYCQLGSFVTHDLFNDVLKDQKQQLQVQFCLHMLLTHHCTADSLQEAQQFPIEINKYTLCI